MLQRYGFLNGERLSLVIGNHDIFGGIQKAEEILTFHEKCEGVHYKERVNNFISYFVETFDNCYYLSSKDFFPFAKRIDNTLLIGLNSVAPYSKLSNPFGSNGEISASQFGELYELLKTAENDVKYKIVMIHHHFNKIKTEAKSTFGSIWTNIEKQTMKLKNKRRLFTLSREFNVDLVLHGHIHESKEYFRKGVRFLNAGATIKSNKASVKINFLKLSKGDVRIEMDSVDLPIKLKTERSEKNKQELFKFINASAVA